MPFRAPKELGYKPLKTPQSSQVHQRKLLQSTNDVLRCTSRKSKYIIHLSPNQQLRRKDVLGVHVIDYSAALDQVNTLLMVNVVNVGERCKSITFITYPTESRRRVNVVNVARRFFGLSRT